ncbi:MAG: hypothetical protein A2287_06865 [Candidatus Melainabacteria bacterium RIFOXYA12_FULL_32_12]|nr:MAG: hypothetical protein A2255_03140 [Candidatus Melainabacteria bacterium RIFOXYA2_FULL_32_9]OGI29006.1 MAG: hypothetical protein A2287_06865 [Candidatus Melainabacteria bacterium RIFOXYA12_FULL_32_12]
MSYINLRPHHFLCIPGYKGYGYSKKFEVNMEKVIKSLTQGVNVKITLGNDDICEHCLSPNSSLCSQAYTEKLDSTVMGILGLKEGEVVDFQEKIDVLKKIMTPLAHQKICKQCVWMKKGLCADTFKK